MQMAAVEIEIDGRRYGLTIAPLDGARVHRAEEKPSAFSVPETAARLGVGEGTVWKLLREGQLESFTIGRRRLIPDAAIRKKLEGAART